MTGLNAVRKFLRDEEGASLLEYCFLLALLAIACFAAMSAAGFSIRDMLMRMNIKLDNMLT